MGNNEFLNKSKRLEKKSRIEEFHDKGKVRRLEKESKKPGKGLFMEVESLGPEWRFVKVVSLERFNQDKKNGILKVPLGHGVYKSIE
jgi:hypothetical protein